MQYFVVVFFVFAILGYILAELHVPPVVIFLIFLAIILIALVLVLL